jgi:hypothetical protein
MRDRSRPRTAHPGVALIAGLMPIQAVDYANSKDFLNTNSCTITCIDISAEICISACRENCQCDAFEKLYATFIARCVNDAGHAQVLRIELISEKSPLVDQILG